MQQRTEIDLSRSNYRLIPSQYCRPFQHMFKLAYIAGPVMRSQALHRALIDALYRRTSPHLFEEVLHQNRQILHARCKRRRVNQKDRKAEVKIRPEVTFLCIFRQRLMRGSDNPHVHLHRLVITDPLQFATLEETQQLRL